MWTNLSVKLLLSEKNKSKNLNETLPFIIFLILGGICGEIHSHRHGNYFLGWNS